MQVTNTQAGCRNVRVSVRYTIRDYTSDFVNVPIAKIFIPHDGIVYSPGSRERMQLISSPGQRDRVSECVAV